MFICRFLKGLVVIATRIFMDSLFGGGLVILAGNNTDVAAAAAELRTSAAGEGVHEAHINFCTIGRVCIWRFGNGLNHKWNEMK